MKIEFYFIISLFFILNCSFFLPDKIHNDQVLNIEKEIPGYYMGKKFFFNRYHEFMGFSNVEKECKLKSELSISCIETFILKNSQIKKIYCFNFNYNQTNEILINYIPECNNKKNFFSSLFKTYNKVRGGGFFILSYDSEPLKKIEFPVSYYYIRSSNDNKFYYEEKHYYLLFWEIGKEITIWEKIN